MTIFRELLHTRKHILALLLGALCLPLLLLASGCADQDREIGPPEPAEDTIKYLFQQDATYKVSAAATTVAVSAYDAEGNTLDGASLLQTAIADMERDGDYIVAEAKIPANATILAYTFSSDAPDSPLEMYAVALKDGQDVYTMSDGDALGAPELFFLVPDVAQKGELFECAVGDELYPVAEASTAGGLKVPVTVLNPVDENVVAYTAATATTPARYIAQAEGETVFVLSLAGNEMLSEEGVSVKAVPPTPTPTPTPTPSPATVNCLFDLADSLADSDADHIGLTVRSFEIVGYTDADCTKECDHTPWKADKDDSCLGAQQTVVLDEVPLDVVRLRIFCLAENGSLTAVGTTAELELTDGEELNLLVKNDATPKQCNNLTLTFANGFGVPAAAVKYRVLLYDDAQILDKEIITTETVNGTFPDSVATDVPLNTASALVECLDSHDSILWTTEATGDAFPQLNPDDDAEVTISDWGEDVTLNVVNAYAMDVDTADVQVCFNDGLEKKAVFTDVAFRKGEGTCSVVFKATNYEGSVSSVTLLHEDVPFEWLDYSSPQAFPGGALELDVNANEFANGEYNASSVMEVANPRHLDNMRYHLDGSFKQIKDIDFAGSCGITNVVTVEKSEAGTEISCETVANDDPDRSVYDESSEPETEPKPRFYGGTNNCYGWLPVGTVDKPRTEYLDFSAMFSGTYNGNGYSIANLVSSIDIHHYPGNTLSGLFGSVTGTEAKPAVIEKVNIADNCSFFSSCSSGPIIGSAYYWVTVKDCETAGDVYAYYYAGGMVGQAGDIDDSDLSTIKIENCTTNSRLYSDDGGGIIGWFSYGRLTLDSCIFGKNGTVTAENGAGGLIYNAGIKLADPITIKDCSALGTISVPANQGIHVTNSSGGIIAILYGQLTITNCTMSCTMDYIPNTADNLYTRRVGGIVGYASEITTDTLKTIFKDENNVKVPEGFMSDSIKEANHIGRYCGRPWLNEL